MTTKPRRFAIKKKKKFKCRQTRQETFIIIIYRNSFCEKQYTISTSHLVLLLYSAGNKFECWGDLQRKSSFSIAIRLRDGLFSHKCQWTCLNSAALPMKPELSSAYCPLSSGYVLFSHANLNDLLLFEIGKGTITITFIVIAATAGHQKPFQQSETEIMFGEGVVKKNGAGQYIDAGKCVGLKCCRCQFFLSKVWKKTEEQMLSAPFQRRLLHSCQCACRMAWAQDLDIFVAQRVRVRVCKCNLVLQNNFRHYSIRTATSLVILPNVLTRAERGWTDFDFFIFFFFLSSWQKSSSVPWSFI